MPMMSRRIVPLLAFGALVMPALAGAQCTKDTDCKYDRVCVAGECLSPSEEASRGGVPDKADQKQRACAQKCVHEESKCYAKVRPNQADSQLRRQACFTTNQRCLSDCGIGW